MTPPVSRTQRYVLALALVAVGLTLVLVGRLDANGFWLFAVGLLVPSPAESTRAP